tara:strand:- start:305 stop:1111 length:807 start_codon:yes stop_codon:yes gene_type:complete
VKSPERGAKKRKTSSGQKKMCSMISNYLLITFFSMLSVSFISVYMYPYLNQRITAISIISNLNHVRKSTLTEILRNEVRGGYISADLEQLKNVLQTDPWIEKVKIRRVWPSSLEITIVEETPIARWGVAGFLNSMGKQLSTFDKTELLDLPLLKTNFISAEKMMEQYKIFSEQLFFIGLKIEELEYDRSGSWRINTADSFQIFLGRDGLLEKLKRFNQVWLSQLRERRTDIDHVDLRYSNGMAVAWRESLLLRLEIDEYKQHFAFSSG